MDDRIDLAPGQKAGGPHPHAGFETVPCVVEGELRDRGEGMLGTGDVLGMTAGGGVIHNEDVPPLGKSRILQLWLTLPQQSRWAEPRFEHIVRDAAPVRREPGADARVYSGSSGSARATTHNHVPVTFVDLRLEPGARFEQELPDSYNGFLYVLEGDVDVGPERTRLTAGQVGWLAETTPDASSLRAARRPERSEGPAPVVVNVSALRITAEAPPARLGLTSVVTVLRLADAVQVFQNFGALDLLSQGRMEMVVGRGSFVESFPLFGLRLEDYDSLFAENLELLLEIRANERVTWSGRHRAPLTGQGVYPRPLQDPLPIWLGVGGTPKSFARAGVLGLPLMVAIIGGGPHRFRPLVDLYRATGRQHGHSADHLKVGLHMLGYIGVTQ